MTPSDAENSQKLRVICAQPVMLAGPPSSCGGHVLLENATESSQRVKGMVLRSEADALFKSGGVGDAGGECAPSPREITLRAFGRLGPGECGELSVELQLHPATPPGLYPATIEYPKGALTPACVQVLEQRETRIHPAVIPLSVRPGQLLCSEVVAKNLGNVEGRIARGVAVLLSPADETWHDYIHQAARTSGAEGHEPFFDDFARRLGESEIPRGRAKVRVGAGPLRPLETRCLRVELQVPTCLKGGRRYTAVSRLGDGALTFILDILDGPEAPDEGEVSQ